MWVRAKERESNGKGAGAGIGEARYRLLWRKSTLQVLPVHSGSQDSRFAHCNGGRRFKCSLSASLIDAVPSDCPRVLINLEKVGELASSDGYEGGGMGGGMYNETGFDFDGLTYGGKDKTRDVFWQGKADDGVAELVKLVGEEWEKELTKLKEDGYAKLDGVKKTEKIDTKTADSKKDDAKDSGKITKADSAVVEKKEAGDKLANPDHQEDTSTLDELTRDLESKAKLEDETAPTNPEGSLKKHSNEDS